MFKELSRGAGGRETARSSSETGDRGPSREQRTGRDGRAGAKGDSMGLQAAIRM